MPKYSIRMRPGQLEKILPNLETDRLYRSAWKKVLASALDILDSRIVRRVPQESGRLLASKTRTMDSRPLPLWGRIALPATNPRDGFQYGFALNASKVRKFRYRSGARSGRLTRSWLSGAMRGMRRVVDELMLQARGEIEGRWRP